MKKQILLFILMLLPMITWADPVEIDGIYYNLIDKGQIAEVTFGNYKGNLIIPEHITYNGQNYSVTNIGNKAFYSCVDLVSVIIPNSVIKISDMAFTGCKSLFSITIPNSVTSIGDQAFRGCVGLISINVESGNLTYDSRDNCNAIIETESNIMIAGCKNTEIPNSVISLYETFSDCTELSSIIIPNSVTDIGRLAFVGCTGLTSISIPNSVTTIGMFAFSGCTGLTSISIPNSVTAIGYYAFKNCDDLTTLIIRENVTTIGMEAFSNCKNLSDVYCYPSTSPYTFSNLFDGSYIEYATLHVPAESINAYQREEPWKKFDLYG